MAGDRQQGGRGKELRVAALRCVRAAGRRYGALARFVLSGAARAGEGRRRRAGGGAADGVAAVATPKIEKELLEIPERIKYQKDLISKCEMDFEFYKDNKREYDKEERKIIRQDLFLNIQENELKKNETCLFDYQGLHHLILKNIHIPLYSR